MPLDLKYQTAAEFIARFRQRFRNAEREEAAKMAHWLYTRWQAGDITWAQIQNAFNLDTQAKRDAFQAKLLNLKNAWDSVQSAQGE